MGVNNKARRAAKRRKQRTVGSDRSTPGGTWAKASGGGPSVSEPSRHGAGQEPADVRGRLLEMLRVAQVAPELAADRLRKLMDSAAAEQVARELAGLLSELITTAALRYWSPTDLGEITRRRLSPRHVPVVAVLVAAETDRHPAATVAGAWREALRDLGPAKPLDLADPTGALLAMEVASLLQSLPSIAEVMPPPGITRRRAGPTGAAPPSAMLAKVRALLAKAESTEFPDEAEALSAKAQELIATYALDRYAAQLETDEVDDSLAVRRLWIDPPYVDAKAMLVDAVASSNHCRSVFSTHLGFVTLVGQAPDIDASELLLTSLQVQADRVMVRQGRIDDPGRRSRTRSFRRSFLVSYAVRIGERLREAADATLAASTRSTELVPVMARSDERVRAATEELFPELVTRSTRISNAAGWAAGRAAADLAVFDGTGQLADRAAG